MIEPYIEKAEKKTLELAEYNKKRNLEKDLEKTLEILNCIFQDEIPPYTVNERNEVIIDGIGFISAKDSVYDIYQQWIKAKYFVKVWYSKEPLIKEKCVYGLNDIREILKEKVKYYE